MKNVYGLLMCLIFSIVVIFSGHLAQCQYYYPVNSSAGNSPPIPQLYTSEQNIDDTKSMFGSVMSAGNILYIPVIKTFVPADSTPLSPDAASQSTERNYVIRAIDFSDPTNPALINDMDIDIDIDQYPQLYISISDNYIYTFNGEMDMWGDYSPEDSTFEEVPPVKANFTIYEIQNNHDIIKIKDLPLTNILDTVRGDQDGLLQAQLLTITDDRAYLTFYGIFTPDPILSSYTSEVVPGSYPTVEVDEYSDEGYIPVDTSYSYYPWKPDNNTIIVSVDITDPSNATILGASRPHIASTGANSDMEVVGTTGYFIVTQLDSKETSLYVLDFSSPENITVKNSLTLFGQGGQMARQGNYLYIAAHDFGLEVVNISEPLNPELIGWFETPHPLTGMYGSTMGGENNIVVKNDHVYMIEREDGLFIIDVSDPRSPKHTVSYLSEYISESSEHYFYAPYTSVDNAGDYLFLREMGALDILSIENPDDPVSVGIFGVREAGILMLALRLESAGLVKITTEETPDRKIALFGIPSLDTLSRKYGVIEIVQANEFQKYYTPYMSYPPEETEPSVEDITKDRDLRTYYLSFPASVSQDEIIADYLKDPYVITAELGMPEIYGPYGYSGGPYYPIESGFAYSAPEPMTGVYGGIYGGSYSGGLYSSAQIPGYPSYYGPGGTYTDLSFPTVPYANIPSTSGYPSYYGYGGLGMLGGLATSYPVSVPGVYGEFGLSGSYSGLMPPLSASTSLPEINIHIGAINIEGGVHIGELTINSEPSGTIPGLSIMLTPDAELLRESALYPPQTTLSSDNEGLPDNTGLTNNSGINQLNTGETWLGTQKKASSPFWNNWPISSSAQLPANSWIW
ncbi:MAG: LVIVD repeat-containing protein [bacterium]